MDFFGNLSWVGVVGGFLLALYSRLCSFFKGVISCSFLSIAYLMPIDIVMFETAAIFWVLMYAIFLFSFVLLGRLGFVDRLYFGKYHSV
jgi:hypothetical protein